jgi:hypothetical protein
VPGRYTVNTKKKMDIGFSLIIVLGFLRFSLIT